MLGLIIAAIGGFVGASIGVGATTYSFIKKGGIQLDILNQNNAVEKSEEETQIDEEGNPIVKAVEIKEDNQQIFHAVKEEEPKSPFKSDKHVNGVETVDPQN